MGHKHKKSTADTHSTRDHAKVKASAAGDSGKPPPNRKRTWFETHGRDLRFLITFIVLMGIYYSVTTMDCIVGTPKEKGFFPWYLEANARASVSVLQTFGYPGVTQEGKSVVSSRGSITVERGCDAIEPSALFVSAVLASPVAIGSRLLAAVVGTVLLLSINLVRIISLFLCAVHWTSAFNIMHLDVWQALFIILAIVLWALWAAWAVARQKKRQVHARA